MDGKNKEHKTAKGCTKNRLRARERETKRKKASKDGILLFGEFHHQVVGIGFGNRNKAVAKSHLENQSGTIFAEALDIVDIDKKTAMTPDHAL